MDEDGFIRKMDRQSRYTQIGGEMVPYAKIEQILPSATAGAPCVVTAVTDDRRGERLVAFNASTGTTPRQLWQLPMASGLPKLWVPQPHDIHMIVRLGMLSTGKVDWRAIKELALQLPAEVCSHPQPLREASDPNRQLSVMA